MKFLITGARGQLGREWMDYLEKSHHEGTGFGSREMDITNEELVYRKIEEIKPDAVINCAAYTAVDDAEDNREEAFKINKTGAEILARTCRQAGVKLVHYSTDYVFEGSDADREKLPKGYPESHPANPQNVYGASKFAGEQAVEKSGAGWLIIRVSWLCGQFGSNFVKTMLRLSRQRDELRVVNDQTGSPTFCTDLVKKTIALVEMDQKGYFHISSKGPISWFELTGELLRQTGRENSVRLVPVSSAEFSARAKRPSYSLLDCSKIEKLGLQSIGWKDGLESLLRQINKKI
jgi:dTDP-4-dehydrorhamnose reductase